MNDITGNESVQPSVEPQEQSIQTQEIIQEATHKIKVRGEELEVPLSKLIENAQKYENFARKHGNKFDEIASSYDSLQAQVSEKNQLLETIYQKFEDPEAALELVMSAHGDKALKLAEKKILHLFEEEQRLAAMDPNQRRIIELEKKYEAVTGKLSEKEKKEQEFENKRLDQEKLFQEQQEEREIEGMLIKSIAPSLIDQGFKIDANATKEDIALATKELKKYYDEADALQEYIKQEYNQDISMKEILSNKEYVDVIRGNVLAEKNKQLEYLKSSLKVEDISSLIEKHGVENVFKKLSGEQIRKVQELLNKKEHLSKDPRKGLNMDDVFSF